MAGHSHWKSIKHRKGAADAKRGKVFSKFAKLITVAARSGGGNPADNLRLRYAIEKARAESMPKESIARAIKKGTGELGGGQLEELTYEGIGPAGVSFVIEVLTDNRNRTGGEIRNLLENRGGSLGKSNSVLWKFDRKGILEVPASAVKEEEIFEASIEAGADDVVLEEGSFSIHTRPEDFDAVRSRLHDFLVAKRKKPEKKWGEEEDDSPVFTRSELAYLAQNPIAVSEEKAEQVLSLFNDIEDHEEVQNVFSDFDISRETLEAISSRE
jgi:YebC/PmpR family DNA-binding regulatory protein